MSKNSNKAFRAFKSGLRSLGRAFHAQDAKAFDAAMGEIEDAAEEICDAEEDPDTIEVHNHIPDSHMRDTSLGELPPKDPAKDSEEEPGPEKENVPPWAKDMLDGFKSMKDDVSALQKWAKEEGKEKSHQEDEGEDPHKEDEHEVEDDSAEEENLEMADRHKDRRHDDRRDHRHDDRRHDDEANKAILGELEFEAPPGTGDKAKKARDSRYLEDAFQDVLSKAEVIAPGISLPTFDEKAPPTKTFRAIDRLRRTALDLAYNKAETRGIIENAMSQRTFDSKRASFSNTRVLFNVVAGAAGTNNNSRATDGTGVVRNNGAPVARIQSIADMNKVNREAYGKRA